MTFRQNLLLSLRQQNGTCPLHCTAKQGSYLHCVSGFNWLRIRSSGGLLWKRSGRIICGTSRHLAASKESIRYVKLVRKMSYEDTRRNSLWTPKWTPVVLFCHARIFCAIMDFWPNSDGSKVFAIRWLDAKKNKL